MKKIDKREVKALVKSNKYTVFVLACFACFLVLLFLGYKLFFPNTGAPVYGDRLDGIEEGLTKELKSKDFVEDASAHINGRIIKPIVTVKTGTKVGDAKGLTDVVIKYFEQDYVDFYDFEVFIKCSETSENGYPIIAYKSNSSKTFSYSSAK